MFLLSGKTNLAASGLFQGYTETHCHLLPGVDDGVDTMEESLAVLRAMAGQGVEEVWLTPHVMEDMPNTPEGLQAVFEGLREAVSGDGGAPYPRLRLAAEYMLDGGFGPLLAEGRLLRHRGGALLVETSYFNPPYGLGALLERVRAAGFFPLLAHPERYVYMDEGDYRRLKAAGVLFQLNLPSLCGFYGRQAQGKAERMLRKGLYDACGMDTHSLHAYNAAVEAKIDRKYVKMLEEITQK